MEWRHPSCRIQGTCHGQAKGIGQQGVPLGHGTLVILILPQPLVVVRNSTLMHLQLVPEQTVVGCVYTSKMPMCTAALHTIR